MKIRRILSVFLLTVLMVSLILTPQAYALPALEIKAKAAVLVDADEWRIIFWQNDCSCNNRSRKRSAPRLIQSGEHPARLPDFFIRLGDFLKPRIPVFFHTAIFPGLSPNPTEGLFLSSAC